MAGLRLTDGTTTVTLTSSPWLGATYTPEAAEFGVTEVTETAVCVIEGSAATIRAAVNAIELLLHDAWQRDRVQNARLYVEYRPLDSDSYFRSVVVGGSVQWSSNPAKRRLSASTNTVELAITWTRRNWWEGDEAELQLSTSNAAAATGGRTIYNHDDSGTGHDNWVQIAAAQVTGDLPGACRVQLANSVGSARSYRKLFLGVNAYSDPGNLTHMLEAESASGGGTVTSDANCSNSSRLDIAPSSSTITLTWSLSAAQLQRTRGRWFRLLLRVNDHSGDLRVRPQVRDASGAYTLWSGDAVVLPSQYGGIFDLGSVPLPPGGYASAYGALTLAIQFTGTSVTELDFVQLTPLDSFRYLECMGSVANGESVVDNGYDGLAYVLSGSAYLPLVAPRGEPLMLFPGLTQRVIVLQQNLTGNSQAPIADTFSVRVWHRPRRRTI